MCGVVVWHVGMLWPPHGRPWHGPYVRIAFQSSTRKNNPPLDLPVEASCGHADAAAAAMQLSLAEHNHSNRTAYMYYVRDYVWTRCQVETDCAAPRAGHSHGGAAAFMNTTHS